MEQNRIYLPIFVYGTLKRGEERAGMWPHAPLKIRDATTRAALYDLGPYPALGDGDDGVAGELWFVATEHMERTLAALDAIEGYNQGDDDLYLRVQVECEDAAGESHTAFTYVYADDETLSRAVRVKPNSDGVCIWSTNQQ